MIEGPFSVPGWVRHATRVTELAGTGAPLGVSPRGDRLFALAAVGERTLVRVIDLR